MIFLIVSDREQLKQIFNKITNDDQYKINAVFAGVFVEQLQG